MVHKLLWTRRASRRLDEIGAYIAAENPAAAAKVLTRIAAAAQRLTEFPDSGRPGRLNNTRELVLADIPYVIPYRVVHGGVQIITVVHTAQRWPLRRP